MGFLQNLFAGREVSRLEELIRSSPAPSLFVRLSQLYRERGEPEKADEVTRRGAELFPESEALTQAQEDAEKIQRDAERRRLRARIERYPSPMLYAKLAELYLEDLDMQEAEKVCLSGTRAYPEYGGLWVVLADVSAKRNDLTQALAHLEKATHLDKYNYNALMQLAEVSLRSGKREKARESLEKILFFAPSDAKATQWLADFDERAQRLEAESAAASATNSGQIQAGPGESDIPAATDAEAGNDKHSSGIGTSLHLEIREIRRVEGVEGSLLIDAFGMVIAADLPEGMNEELAGALITNICRTATDHSEALTIGTFEEAMIDCGDRRIQVLRVAEMIMGVITSPQTKTGLLQRAIHTFAERVLETHH